MKFTDMAGCMDWSINVHNARRSESQSAWGRRSVSCSWTANETNIRLLLMTVLLFLLVPCVSDGATPNTQIRDTVDLNLDWKFQSFEIYNDANATGPLRTGPAGLEATDFDDRDWRRVSIPHDWSIEGDYDPDHPTRDNSGYLPAGIGWYRKTIAIPDSWQGRRVWLEFDGAFRKSTVWVNGMEMGHRPYGWISFGYDISRAVAGRKQAVIAVRLDCSQQNAARWYTGSGIYAPVRIEVTAPVHIAPNGTFVRDPGLRSVTASR